MSDLPTYRFEAQILEVGDTDGEHTVKLTRVNHRRPLTIVANREAAMAFCKHLYGKVRVTIEVLPADDAPKGA